MFDPVRTCLDLNLHVCDLLPKHLDAVKKMSNSSMFDLDGLKKIKVTCMAQLVPYSTDFGTLSNFITGSMLSANAQLLR